MIILYSPFWRFAKRGGRVCGAFEFEPGLQEHANPRKTWSYKKHQMGTSRLLRATWQKCQSPGGEPPENPEKITYFHCFFNELLVKTHSKTSGKPVRSFWTGLSLPRPFPTHFTSILYFRFFFWKKNASFFQVFLKYFLYFHCFLSSWGSGTTPRL